MIKIVERRSGWKRPNSRDRVARLKPNEFVNGDVEFTLVNLNFGKQILVSPLWFASLLFSLAITLCFRFDLLGCVVSVCAGTRNIFDITCRDTTLSYICARVKEGSNSDIGQVLHRTGLTEPSNRSDWLPAFILQPSLWLVCVLISVLSAEICRNLITHIHPPLGDIQRSFHTCDGLKQQIPATLWDISLEATVADIVAI